MATVVCSASPRNSFSQDTDSVAVAAGEGRRWDGLLPPEAGSGEFNFSVSFQSSINDSSDAEELFSDGKILPFFKPPVPAENNPAPAPPPILDHRDNLREIPESAARSGENDARAASGRRSGGRQSIWRFGRSSSVGSAAPPGPILPLPLHRSKSTGSFPPPSYRPRQPAAAASMVWNGKIAADSNPRKTYYYSGSQRGSHRGGVRITPVLNVPAPVISRSSSSSSGSSAAVTSLFNYLLCNCGGEERRDEIEAS